MAERKRGRSAKSLLDSAPKKKTSKPKAVAKKKSTKAKATKVKTTSKVTAKPKLVKVKKETKPVAFDETKLLSEQEFFQAIQEKAYEIYLNRSEESGSAENDWLKAEQIVKTQYNH